MSENTIDPDELTSPHTVEDPELERRRAEQAAAREAESRASSETKFEELRREEEHERSDAARIVGDVPKPRAEDD
jgi:hypothetical protein